MCATIVRIEAAGPERRARRLVFDDGHEPRDVSSAVARQLSLQEGLEVDLVALEESIGSIETSLAKARALQLLGYRERSRSELFSKLCATGYPAPVADLVVARFVEVELVDDFRFAAAFARSRAAAGYGNRRIARELAAKGISDELVAEALGSLEPPDTELSRAQAALQGRMPADTVEARKLVRRLVSRGFDLSVAIQAVDATGDLRDSDERSGTP